MDIRILRVAEIRILKRSEEERIMKRKAREDIHSGDVTIIYKIGANSEASAMCYSDVLKQDPNYFSGIGVRGDWVKAIVSVGENLHEL